MKIFIARLALLLIGLYLAETFIVKQESCFRAAVYEHVVAISVDGDLRKTIQANLDIFENVTQRAKELGADIIVFPERGIIPLTIKNRTLFISNLDTIPDPKVRVINPCQRSSEFPDISPLVRLSCMARNNSIYVVANVIDIQWCKDKHTDITTCPPDGAYIYNTNVVFNKQGELVGRYHKLHLFFEENYDAPSKPEFVHFDSEFGRMGTVTCFDMVFKEAAELVRNFDIDTLLYPTQWTDELPTYSAPAIQQSFAVLHNVNVLAANIHLPLYGAVGSGIYSGQRGALIHTHAIDNLPRLLITTVPKKPKKKDLTCNDPFVFNDKTIREHVFNETEYNYLKTDFKPYKLSKLQSPEGKTKVCHRGLCCRLRYRIRNAETSFANDEYYLGAHNGTKTIAGRYRICEETCVLVRCNVGERPPCTEITLRTSTSFKYIHMSATFTAESVFPGVVDNEEKLTPKTYWNFSFDKDRKEAVLPVQERRNPILVASLTGRCFERDPPYVP